MATTVSDIEVGLGRLLTDSEQAQASQWIDDALLLITTKFGALFVDLDGALVDYVIRSSVVARFQGLGEAGMSSLSVAVDDASVTRRWENSGSRPQDDWLLAGWFDLLAPTRDSAAFSTRPGFDPDTAQWPVSTPRGSDPDWQRDWH